MTEEMDNYSISVVIPVYNGAKTLDALVARIGPVLQSLTAKFEILLINDNSEDSSWEVIRELSHEYGSVNGIDLMRNYGQHNALLCGIRSARCDLIVTMDDDLQNPPEEIPKMVSRLREGYDVVYGKPAAEKHNAWRDCASIATKYILQSTMGVEVARNVGTFRVFRTVLRDAFKDHQSQFITIDVLLTWGTTRFSAVTVEHNRRQTGSSNYT